ncbi:MAG: DUF1549 domain-containing protein, partial [Pirellulaceae bacterium]|nr:DUF1549 domain-containing protein [Pirellulaceae bacterium]
MRNQKLSLLAGAIALAGLTLCGATVSAAEVDFSRDVLPILSDHCFQCHGPDEAKREAELRLDTETGALRKDDPVIIPGKVAESELMKRVLSDDPDEQMPPADAKRRLTGKQQEILKQWIAGGADWQRHWAFVKPVRTQPPAVDDAWPRSAIDRFVFDRLRREGVKPQAEANRRALIRRVTLDLTGLPPTADEVGDFLEDKEDGAFERVVDRLLKSPHYGERMAWDWLAIARYADTNGYQGDRTRTMWPWRDWVVAAFNSNMPYDQFTIEQLAGDLLPDPTMAQRIATGFHRNHMINGEGGRIPEENRVEYIFDQVETTATTWLGLTMTCVRCHDHKYDPIVLDDYYGIFAVFNNTPVNGGGGDGQTAPVVQYFSDADRQRQTELRESVGRLGKELDEVEQSFFPRPEGKNAAESEKAAELADAIKSELKKPAANRDHRRLGELIKVYKDASPDYAKLVQQLKAAMEQRDSLNAKAPRVMVMQEAKARETFVLTRGAYDKKGRQVKAALIGSLHAPPADQPINRLALARWIVDAENPLTARVTVNRFWQMFFGSGLVRSPEDFGVQGRKPSHPRLLDWLAVDFVESGWDAKRLVNSATYRQSTKAGSQAYADDPGNRLLARGPRHRLPSWMIRDQALAISGLLNREMGGPSVNSYQPAGVWAEATFGKIKYQRDSG